MRSEMHRARRTMIAAFADDRFGDDSADLPGGQPYAFACERLGLCDDGLHERVVATALFRGHAPGDAFGGGDKAISHLGGDRTRFDDNDFHAEIGDLAAQRIADSLEGDLGTGVWSVACHGHLAPDRRYVDNRPAVLNERGQKGLRHRDVAEEVDVEEAAPLGERQRLHRRVDLDSGVVDEGAQGTAVGVVGDAASPASRSRPRW